MTEAEFTDMAASLHTLAEQRAGRYRLAPHDAEDIAQDTMLKLWSLRGDISSAKHARGLAVTIAAHLAIDHLRQQRTVPLDGMGGDHEKATPDPLPDSAAQAPDSHLEEEDNARWLKRQLARLPSSQYEVMRLKQVEGRSLEEIAAIMGIKPSSVATLLSRARHELLRKIRERK